MPEIDRGGDPEADPRTGPGARARLTNAERIAGLEARVAELELQLRLRSTSSATPITPTDASDAIPLPLESPQPPPLTPASASLWTSSGAPPPQTALPTAGPAAVPPPALPPPAAPPPAPASGWAAHSRATAGWIPPNRTARPASTGRSWSVAELEQRLTGRLLAWIGGAAMLLGAVLFMSLAFSRGWIGPAGRVAIGLVVAIVLFGIGAWLFERRPHQRIVATVLVGVGVGVGMVAIIGATRIYGLIPVELGLLMTLVLAIAAATIALRADSMTVAIFGLVAVLGAPPLLGAAPGPVTIALVGAVLVGTTAITLARSWRWVPMLAFLLSAPQLLDWIARADTNVPAGLVALAAFWLIYTVSAGGEELLRPSDDLRESSASLALANASYLVIGGFVLLDRNLEGWRGAFLLGAGLAHLAVAALYFLRRGDRHPFGLIVAGTGVVALSLAVPVQFAGPTVPVLWAGQATVLAWIFGSRRHHQAGVTAAALGALALGHLVALEYPFDDLREPFGAALGAGSVPFINQAGLTLAFLLAALAIAGWFVRDPRIRVVLAAIALELVTYALPFELAIDWVVVAWCALAVAVYAATYVLRRFGPILATLALGVGLSATALAGIVAVTVVALPSRLMIHGAPIDQAPTSYLAVVAVAAALGVGVRIGPLRPFAAAALMTAAGVLVYLVSIVIVDAFRTQVGGAIAIEELAKQAQVVLSVSWTVEGTALFVLGLARRRPALRQFGLGLLALATAKVFLFDLASLDVAYRVLSLVGLGVLLLASAYLYQRLRPATAEGG